MIEECLFEVPEEWWRRRRCTVCGGAVSLTFDHVYVVQRQGWVKIGATSNLRRRLCELARPAWRQHLLSPDGMDWMEPLTVLGVTRGDVEHELHRQFVACHAVGEWFLPNVEMRAWLVSGVLIDLEAAGLPAEWAPPGARLLTPSGKASS